VGDQTLDDKLSNDSERKVDSSTVTDTEPPGEQPAPLQEGLDYYLENGLFVFTAAFLKKRGYCCENRCRHCPYQKETGE
jgi:hypothetical protein